MADLLLPHATRKAPAVAGIGPPFELAELLHRCGGNERLARRMLERFASVIGAEIAQLQASVVDVDRTAIARISHGMFGWAGNLAASGLAKSASRLESRSAQADPAELNRCLASIVDEARQCGNYLPAALAALAGAPAIDPQTPRGV